MRPTLLMLVLAACSAGTKPELCANGLDDDGDGLIDCSDAQCTGAPECGPKDAGLVGTCAKCGQGCNAQSVCVADKFTRDRPLAQCENGFCRSLNQSLYVALTLRLDNAWSLVQDQVQSGAIRFIKKRAVDGSPVTCDQIANAASATNAQALEQSGRFNLQSIEVYRINNTMPIMGLGIRFPILSSATGGDFLIYVELWDQGVGTENTYPTGRRMGWACDESSFAEITATQGCPLDAGTCRGFSLTVPGPR